MKNKRIMASWQTELVLDDGYKIVSNCIEEGGALNKIFAFTGKHAPDPIELDFARTIQVEESRIQMPVLSEVGARYRYTNISQEDLYLIVERFEWSIELDAGVSKFCQFIAKRKGTATSAVLEP